MTTSARAPLRGSLSGPERRVFSCAGSVSGRSLPTTNVHGRTRARGQARARTDQAAAEGGRPRPTDPTKPKRRRGSRGGRGRKKPGAAAGGQPRPSEEKKDEAKQPQRRELSQRQERRREQSHRRRREPHAVPAPAAKRELLVSVDVGERRVAILEDGGVAEVYLERPERRSIAGNIYLGRVDNVLPGMEAASVEIGLKKNGFLYVDEMSGPSSRRGRAQDPGPRLAGQKILVQAVKDPMKTRRAADDEELAARPLRRLRPQERASACRAASRTTSEPAQGHPQAPRGEGGRRHRPHRRRGRVGGGHRARPRFPAAALALDPGQGEDRSRRSSSTRRPSCRCASSATSSPTTSRRLVNDERCTGASSAT